MAVPDQEAQDMLDNKDMLDNISADGQRMQELFYIRQALDRKDLNPEDPFTAGRLAEVFGESAPPQSGYNSENIQSALTKYLEGINLTLGGVTKKMSEVVSPDSIAQMSRTMHRNIKSEAEVEIFRRNKQIDEVLEDIPETESDPDVAENMVRDLEVQARRQQADAAVAGIPPVDVDPDAAEAAVAGLERGLSPGAPAEPQPAQDGPASGNAQEQAAPASADELIERAKGIRQEVVEETRQAAEAPAGAEASPSESVDDMMARIAAGIDKRAEARPEAAAPAEPEQPRPESQAEPVPVEPPEPAAAAEPPRAEPEPAPAPETAVHEVQPGDTLSKIVRDHYGADAKVDYMAVAEYNRQNNPELSRDLVANPHDIREGDQIKLPPQTELEGIDAPASPAQADPRLAEVQSYLYAKGYEEVKIDGLDDGATRAALLGEGIEPDQDMAVIHAKVAELAGHGNDDINGFLNREFHVKDAAEIAGSDEAKAAQGLLNLRNDGDLKLDGRLGPKSRELETADRQARGEAVAALDAQAQQAETEQAFDRMAEGVGVEQVPPAAGPEQEKGTWDKIKETLGADQPREQRDRGTEYDVHIDRNANGWPSIRLERIDPGAIKVGGDPVITKPYNEAAAQTAGTMAPQLERQEPQAQAATPPPEPAVPQDRQWQAPKI